MSRTTVFIASLSCMLASCGGGAHLGGDPVPDGGRHRSDGGTSPCDPNAPDNTQPLGAIEMCGGAFPDLAIDGAGRAHAGYGQYGILGYALRSSSTWTCETVVDSTNSMQPREMFFGLGPNDVLHLVGQFPTTTDIAETPHYATTETGTWTTERLDGVGLLVGMGVDAAGHPHVVAGIQTSYFRQRFIQHATNATGTWVTENMGPTPYSDSAPTETAVAVEPSGTVHVLYLGEPVSGMVAMMHVSGAAGAYTERTIDVPRSSYCRRSIAAGQDGVHLAYVVDDVLHYAHFSGGAWTDETLALPSWITDVWVPAIVLDARGAPRIVFSSPRGIWAVVRVDGSWEVRFVAKADSPSTEPGPCPMVAIDANDALHFAGGGTYFVRAASNGTDDNCDGVDGVDADGDGEASSTSGGGDCNDGDPSISSTAADPPGDGIDQNCDGLGTPG